jgi:hypothetical protein
MNFSAKRFAEIFASLIPMGASTPLGGDDRRRAPRVEMRLKTRILLAGKPGKTIDIELRDLSVRGMKFVYSSPLKSGQQFVLTVPQMKDEPLPLLCTVVHSEEVEEGYVAVGAEFTCQLPRRGQRPAAGDAERIRNSILS